jgi:uncharacterized protein YunC (DUF1805 family)
VNDELPRAAQREIPLRNGTALGISHRWAGGQYCAILTRAGVVGCGIYDLQVAARFGMAFAIARGTPSAPLVEPEDLLDARILEVSPRAKEIGLAPGITGREAVELLLATSSRP